MRECTGEVYVEPGARRLTSQANGLEDVTRIGQLFFDRDIAVDDLGLQRPSLDDVFLNLTGHRAEPSSEEPDTGAGHDLEGATR